MPQPILITGATGFIGRHLVPALLAQNHPVSLLVRETYGMGTPLPAPLQQLRPDLNLIFADLRNFQQTARTIRASRPEWVIHLAARGATDPFLPINDALRHNLNGTLHLLRACFEKNNSVTRLLTARTPGEQNPSNHYSASKAAAWQFCRMYAASQGWPIIGGIIFQAFGAGQPANTLIPAAIGKAMRGEDFPMTSGKQAKDWIYIADVITGLIAAIQTDLPPGTSIDIGTGQQTAVVDVVRQIYTLTASSGRPLPGTIPDRPGEVQTQIADLAQTIRLTGWQPAYTLETALTRLIESIV